MSSKSEARKGKLERSKKLIDWAISSQASNHQEPFVLMYDEGSTTILYGVESSDSKCRGSQRNLRECDIVWSTVKIVAADESSAEIQVAKYLEHKRAELNNRLWTTGLESDKNQARDQKQSKKYYSNILVIKDTANPENNGKVFLYEYGPMIFKKLEAAMFPQDGAEPIEIFSPFEGSNFHIKISPQPVFNKIVPNYSNSYVSEQTSEIEGDIEEIMNQVYDLSEFTDTANFKSYDELAERLVEVLGYTTGSGVETVAGYGKKVPSKPAPKPSRYDDEDDIPVQKANAKQFEDDEDDDEIEKMKRMLEAMDD